MPPNADRPSEHDEAHDQTGPPVPFQGAPSVPAGVQAFRRGDVILYTVRGEPEHVQELMEQLRGQGVNEVVALISHQAEDPAPDADVAADADADPGPDVVAEGGPLLGR